MNLKLSYSLIAFFTSEIFRFVSVQFEEPYQIIIIFKIFILLLKAQGTFNIPGLNGHHLAQRYIGAVAVS